MKLRLPLFGLLNFAVLNALLAEPPIYKTTPDGVIIFTDPRVTGTSNAVKLEVITDNIIRVIVALGKEIATTQSPGRYNPGGYDV
jgi:alpha-D-xyloside xylohydrolase